MSYCQNCGAYIPDGEKTCLACGWSPDGGAQARAESRREENTSKYYAKSDTKRTYSYGTFTDEDAERAAEKTAKAREDERKAKRRAYANEYRADARENKNLAYLCCLGPLVLIPLLLKPNSAFLRYHCNQGIALALFCILLSLCDWLPVIGGLAGLVGGICAIVWFCMGLSNVSKGRRRPLPVIGGIKILK